MRVFPSISQGSTLEKKINIFFKHVKGPQSGKAPSAECVGYLLAKVSRPHLRGADCNTKTGKTIQKCGARKAERANSGTSAKSQYGASIQVEVDLPPPEFSGDSSEKSFKR